MYLTYSLPLIIFLAVCLNQSFACKAATPSPSSNMEYYENTNTTNNDITKYEDLKKLIISRFIGLYLMFVFMFIVITIILVWMYLQYIQISNVQIIMKEWTKYLNVTETTPIVIE